MSLNFEFCEEQNMLEESVWRWASTWLEPQMEKLYEEDKIPPTFGQKSAKGTDLDRMAAAALLYGGEMGT